MKNKLTKYDLILVDACFAMNSNFEKFISEIEEEFIANDKKITVIKAVEAELLRKTSDGTYEANNKACKALSTLQLHPKIFFRNKKGYTTESIDKSFADPKILQRMIGESVYKKVALLTNDGGLTEDTLAINALKSFKSKEVAVFGLSKNGELVRKVSQVENNVEIEPEMNNVKQDRNYCLPPVFGIAGVVTGLFINKYGKYIYKNVQSYFK